MLQLTAGVAFLGMIVVAAKATWRHCVAVSSWSVVREFQGELMVALFWFWRLERVCFFPPLLFC